ncbi:hypothetical protein evm_014234 [Chilo suppressalis]|nr:hypothetical protein evm_014234 [Chilo suppressalis]
MARFGLVMDYLERAHAEDMRRLRRKRKMIRELCDAFDLPDKPFEDRYRLTKPLVRGLITELHPFLKSTRRRDTISDETKVLTALAFYATGSYQRIVGEERFYNRKQYHSLNVQIICDSDLNILSVDASYPGATNDATVWQMHPLYNYLIECRRNGETLWVLGDSGYPQRTHTMTPIVNSTAGSKESVYTKMHVSARNCVERCIGVLKARFRCLLAARTLHYDPQMAARIVNACCVLHNIAHQARLIQPVLSVEEQQHEQQRQINRIHHEEVTHTRGQANYERSLQDSHNRRVNRALLAGRAERDALIYRIVI